MAPSENGAPNAGSRARGLAEPIFYLCQNTISLIGVVMVTSLFVTMMVLLFANFYGLGSNPYLGILSYVILPSLFLLGLLLIPVGMYLKHHREVQKHAVPEKYPKIDFNQTHIRRVFNFVALATIINVLVFVHASYRGIQYMDSTTFCGQVCHTVMDPEFTAYKNSPHSRVECVNCHIGPGASWFVRSKLSGLRQVIAVTTNHFSRPIQTPIANLRPARETCEQCHWPSRFSGSLLAVRPKYAEDEQNSRTTTVLMVKVGGGTSVGQAIHSTHLDLAKQIRYIAADRGRQQIPWVEYTSLDGHVTEYSTPTWDKNKSAGEMRTMDCMDCHNRPTHTFQVPDQAMNDAMAAGKIDPSLPYIRKKGLELLKQGYPSQNAGAESIYRSVLAYYRNSYPDVWKSKQKEIESSATALQQIYLRNVFPAMKIDWGTYPNNLGHTYAPGCFRCHNGDHSSKEGNAITQDCSSCHALLAVEEANPKILQELNAFAPIPPFSKWESIPSYAHVDPSNPVIARMERRSTK